MAVRPLPAVTPLSDGLSGYEAMVTRGLSAWNLNPVTKRMVSWLVHHVSHRWIQLAISNRLEVRGAEHLDHVNRDRGLLLVANHRTFWDMYVGTSVVTTYVPVIHDLYFPIRKRFFYTHPVGLLLNLAVSGGSMWPPMASGFDRRRRDLVALDALAALLERPRSLVGIHPEGTRKRDGPPLPLLPPKGGIGRLVQSCPPDVSVVPFFLTGMTDDLPSEIASNFRRPERRGRPIRIVFGPPRPAGSFDREAPPRTIATELLDHIADLGGSLGDSA